MCIRAGIISKETKRGVKFFAILQRIEFFCEQIRRGRERERVETL